MSVRSIYLDYAASTPTDPRVIDRMLLSLQNDFANPSSNHQQGQLARDAIEKSRCQIGDLIGAQPNEIIFTSGATEANNLAIKGALSLYQHQKGNHIVTIQTEHKAVLDVCMHLEKQGYVVTYLKPDRNGRIHLDQIKNALTDKTCLVSIMHVNNETGIIQDIAAIAELLAAHQVLFHVDAAQSVNKLPIDLREIPIHLMSFSAHKLYGPKGIGVLYLRQKPRIRLHPLFHGGGHEQGLRSGTLATHQIVGMGEACRILKSELHQDFQHALHLRDHFLNGLSVFKDVGLNTDIQYAVPHIINLYFENKVADALLDKMKTVAVSTGAACSAWENSSSHVLYAMDIPQHLIQGSLRFSFGRFTTISDIDEVLRLLSQCACTY